VSYRFLDEVPTADVGFAATGATLDACFQEAAEATLAVMLGNPSALQPLQRRTVHVADESLELVLLKFLEELVFYKDAQGLFLRASHVAVRQDAGRWEVEATLEGEAIDPSRHELSGDVKAVTLHQLRVQPTDTGWEATVVLDV
jgi:SHS2 domain-containing protein